MNSGETVQLRKLAVSLQGPWLLDWNPLVQDVRGWYLPTVWREIGTDPESWVNPFSTPHPHSHLLGTWVLEADSCSWPVY